ncbi:hypothetical protein [Streptomyces zaomyceticus]|uniref:hypothetical protein n=1 Tax=Streptomyces zaomyceticus TaxID=68286 RepID=UPI00379BDB35
MADLPTPTVRADRYVVNCVPEDGVESHHWGLTVEYRGNGLWGVYRNPHCCLGADGTWSWGHNWRDGTREPATDDEWTEYHDSRDTWFSEHRFDEQTALKLAQEHAPLVTVNGYTVTDALAMQQKRAERHG